MGDAVDNGALLGLLARAFRAGSTCADGSAAAASTAATSAAISEDTSASTGGAGFGAVQQTQRPPLTTTPHVVSAMAVGGPIVFGLSGGREDEGGARAERVERGPVLRGLAVCSIALDDEVRVVCLSVRGKVPDAIRVVQR